MTNTRPEAGQLWRAESGGEARLVLVLAVNDDSVQITTIHPYPEYATSNDIVVEPDVSGVRYPFVVQAAIRGAVFASELDTYITTVSDEVVRLCLAPLPVKPTGMGLSTGTPLLGPVDSRRTFKVHEIESLARLTANRNSII